MKGKKMFERRINIFTGHYKSGKTEVAVNFAYRMYAKYPNVTIVDFDIVNPYFRTADAREELEKAGIKVITTRYANTNIDVPALPSEINAVFENRDLKAVFDVGGDDLGAKAVSRYRECFINDDYELYFVINVRRPLTNTPEKIEDMIGEIEASSRLKITRLVNNTNLLEHTSAGDVLEGQKMIRSVSEKLGIPIGFVSVFPENVGNMEDLQVEKLYMRKFIRLPWDKT